MDSGGQITITKLKPGYAWGYVPTNDIAQEIGELSQDVETLCTVISDRDEQVRRDRQYRRGGSRRYLRGRGLKTV